MIANTAQAIQQQPQVTAGLFIQTSLQTNLAMSLDLNTKDGCQHYQMVTNSLFNESEQFDVEPEKFQMFINFALPMLEQHELHDPCQSGESQNGQCHQHGVRLWVDQPGDNV